MTTKLEAARSAAHSGAATIICHSELRDGLLRAAAGERVGTIFLPVARLASRKHWLAFTTKPRGTLVLDDGAVKAVRDGGRSLLAAGIVEVRGRFGIGDTVSCVDADGREIARGLSSYDAADIARLEGHSAREIRAVLGYSHGDAVIHRDDLVVVS
jgi:glutamate 5-kinase